MLLAAAFMLVMAIVMQSLSLRVNAAALTNTYVRFNRMKAATGTDLRVVFTVPAGNTGTEANLRINLPDDYTVATTGLSASVANCPSEATATALPGTLAVAGDNTASSKDITISGVTDLSASTTYCVDIERASTFDTLTNPAAGQYYVTVETLDGSSVRIDYTAIAARVIADDEIIVNAVVPPTFNFVLDGNQADFLADLDSGTVGKTADRTVTITTNASQGWIAWAKDLNVGLTSAAAGATIASTTPGTAATLSAGTEGYVLGVEATTDAALGGTVTVETPYVGTAADNDGSGLDTLFRPIARANGTANGDVITLTGKAAISSVTPAAVDYTDTWTVIGAGNF